MNGKVLALLNEIKTEQTVMKVNIQDMKVNIQYLKTEQKSIKLAVLEIGETLKSLEGIQERQQHTLDKLEQNQDRQQTTLDKLQQTQDKQQLTQDRQQYIIELLSTRSIEQEAEMKELKSS